MVLERQAIPWLQPDQMKNQTELDLKGHWASEHEGGRRLYRSSQSVRGRKEVWDVMAERKTLRDPGWRKWLPMK